MRYFVLVAALAMLLLSGGSEAAIVCSNPVQTGCYGLHVRVVKYDLRNELIQGLVDGRYESADVAKKIFDAVDRGEIALYQGDVDFKAYMWDINDSVEESTMAAYDENDQKHAVQLLNDLPPFTSDRGFPRKTYAVKVSGGKGVVWQAPWGFLGTNAYILLCFSGKAQPLYPLRHTETGRFPSLDLTTPFLSLDRKNERDGTRLVVVMQ